MQLEITTNPAAATVWIGSQRFEGSPVIVERPMGTRETIRVEASGHVAASRSIEFARDDKIEIALDARPGAPVGDAAVAQPTTQSSGGKHGAKPKPTSAGNAGAVSAAPTATPAAAPTVAAPTTPPPTASAAKSGGSTVKIDRDIFK